MLVYMAAHGFIAAGNRPGTAAQAQPAINDQATQANYCRNFGADSYHLDSIAFSLTSEPLMTVKPLLHA
jgi:hypothetical protein